MKFRRILVKDTKSNRYHAVKFTHGYLNRTSAGSSVRITPLEHYRLLMIGCGDTFRGNEIFGSKATDAFRNWLLNRTDCTVLLDEIYEA
jgi:hypothetical protein